MVSPCGNNVAMIKIKLHCKHANQPFWLIKIKVNKQTVFVNEPYLKTTKLGYWVIALNMQKYGKLEVQTEKRKSTAANCDLQVANWNPEVDLNNLNLGLYLNKT